jgi:hypothetical protein
MPASNARYSTGELPVYSTPATYTSPSEVEGYGDTYSETGYTETAYTETYDDATGTTSTGGV